jgi:Zn finger protein HypA/HybF involved in hydrogenase expression
MEADRGFMISLASLAVANVLGFIGLSHADNSVPWILGLIASDVIGGHYLRCFFVALKNDISNGRLELSILPKDHRCPECDSDLRRWGFAHICPECEHVTKNSMYRFSNWFWGFQCPDCKVTTKTIARIRKCVNPQCSHFYKEGV